TVPSASRWRPPQASLPMSPRPLQSPLHFPRRSVPSMAKSRTKWLTLPVAAGAAVAACVAHGVFVEREWYRRASYRLPILPSGARPVRGLRLSDLHFVHSDRRKEAFLRNLDRPDVLVVTGDLLGEPQAVERVVAALRPLRGR